MIEIIHKYLWMILLGRQNREKESKMAVAKSQGRSKRVQGPGVGCHCLLLKKQHSWLNPICVGQAPNLCCDETKNRGTYTRVTISFFSTVIFQLQPTVRLSSPKVSGPTAQPFNSPGQRQFLLFFLICCFIFLPRNSVVSSFTLCLQPSSPLSVTSFIFSPFFPFLPS